MLVKYTVISRTGGESLACRSLDNELASLSFWFVILVLLGNFSLIFGRVFWIFSF